MSADAPLVIAALAAEPIDVVALTERVRCDDAGALVVFEGTTRTPDAGHDVVALDYEAWEERTPAQLEQIVAQVAATRGLRAAVGVHRVGSVPAGDTAVVVVAVAAHRDAAFAGARELIDRIKSEAWIWKKELRADGEVWVEGAPESWSGGSVPVGAQRCSAVVPPSAIGSMPSFR